MQGKIGFDHSSHATVSGEVRKEIFCTQLSVTCHFLTFWSWNKGFLKLQGYLLCTHCCHHAHRIVGLQMES